MKKTMFLLCVMCNIATALNEIRINENIFDDGIDITCSLQKGVIHLLNGEQASLQNGCILKYADDLLHIMMLSTDVDMLITSSVPIEMKSVSAQHLAIVSPLVKFIDNNNINVLKYNGHYEFSSNCEINGQLTVSDIHLIGSLTTTSEGSICADNFLIEGNDYSCIVNKGNIQSNVLRIHAGSSNFKQEGSLTVLSLLEMNCNFENIQETKVNEMNLVVPITMSIQSGKLSITKTVNGDIGFLNITGGAGSIENLNGTIKLLNVNSGSLIISNMTSAKPIKATIQNGADVQINGAGKCSQFAASDATLSISSSERMSFVSATNSKIKVRGTESRHIIDQLLLTGSAEFDVENASFGNAYIDDSCSGTIVKSKISCLTNNGLTSLEDVRIHDFTNRASVQLKGKSTIERVKNQKEISCSNGEVSIASYVGDRDSKFETTPTIGFPIVEDSTDVSLIRLNDQGISVDIDSATGEGIISSRHQTYAYGFLKGYALKGNADIFLDYMPENTELPEHEGQLRLQISLNKDFINESEKIYKDTIFFFDMNGYDWKNINASFSADGLSVKNAGVFGNYDGKLALQDFLEAKAKQILNSSSPVTRDNGRWHSHHIWFGGNIHFYMPATYYTQRTDTGIVAGGNIRLEGEQSVKNEFSTIAAKGSLEIQSSQEIRNTVATMYSEKDATLTASNIYNEDLGVTVRKGEYHDRGSSGWGPWRDSWHYDIYVAEFVNKSDGAKMIFGDQVQFNGMIHNVGSTLVGKQFDVTGLLENKDVLAHTADVISPVVLGDNVPVIAMQLWTTK